MATFKAEIKITDIEDFRKYLDNVEKMVKYNSLMEDLIRKIRFHGLTDSINLEIDEILLRGE